MHSLKEIINTIFAGVTARLAYRLILQRSIDSFGLDLWKNRLKKNRSHLPVLVNSLFLSVEYEQRIADNPLNDVLLSNYLHVERCKLVKALPRANFIIDLGGSSPNNPRGGCSVWGIPTRSTRYSL